MLLVAISCSGVRELLMYLERGTGKRGRGIGSPPYNSRLERRTPIGISSG